MAKIGLLVIATNKYIQFVDPLWESAQKHFMSGHEVTMFVFTNMTEFQPKPGQVVIPQGHMAWPGPTLFRYNIFQGAKDKLAVMDYLYYCDADMRFVDTVGDEILGDLVGTIHPGFFHKPRTTFTYETNPNSKAFIPANEGIKYFAGGFNGGTSEKFLAMCDQNAENISSDYKKGIIAVWHDESHMNRYFVDNPPTVQLSPAYCYPESWNIPFEKRLLALDKNHKEIRS